MMLVADASCVPGFAKHNPAIRQAMLLRLNPAAAGKSLKVAVAPFLSIPFLAERRPYAGGIIVNYFP
jgi:hypothetical protein